MVDDCDPVASKFLVSPRNRQFNCLNCVFFPIFKFLSKWKPALLPAVSGPSVVWDVLSASWTTMAIERSTSRSSTGAWRTTESTLTCVRPRLSWTTSTLTRMVSSVTTSSSMASAERQTPTDRLLSISASLNSTAMATALLPQQTSASYTTPANTPRSRAVRWHPRRSSSSSWPRSAIGTAMESSPSRSGTTTMRQSPLISTTTTTSFSWCAKPGNSTSELGHDKTHIQLHLLSS